VSDQKNCSHGVPFARTKDGHLHTCPRCDLLWHENGLAAAEVQVSKHKRKIQEAIAAISHECGDA